MNEPEYRSRLSLARKAEDVFRLADEALVVARDGGERRVRYADIRQIRVYESPGVGGISGFARCVVRPKRGRRIVLSSNYFVGLGRFEDRFASFAPFVEALVRRVAARNHGTRFVFGMPPALWWIWVLILAAVALVAPLALLVIVVEAMNGRGLPVQGLVALGIVFTVFLSLFSYIRQLRRNRPRRFEPREPGWDGLWRPAA